MNRLIIIVIILCFIPFLLFPDIIQLQNEYIKVMGDQKTARFAIKTTGGDPELKTDQDAFLLYYDDIDYPSSYTTIRIDGKDYIFGSRSGRVIRKLFNRGSYLVSAWGKDDVSISQRLRFVKGVTTGNVDTIEVSYRVWNKDVLGHSVGVRIVFDTYLGREDGAPFRVPGVGPILTEKKFSGRNVPKYWYSYDDLINPSVRAQGTLYVGKSPRPDKLVFASFSRFNDYLWDFPIEEGNSFRRGFLQPMDSAVAVYWEPKEVSAKASFTVKTCLGLHGSTIKKGKGFTVALNSPVEVTDEKFVINADLQNISSDDASDVIAVLALPEGLEFAGKMSKRKNIQLIKKSSKKIGSLESSEMSRATWEVVPAGTVTGPVIYKVYVKGNIDEKTTTTKAERDITILEKEKKTEAIREIKIALAKQFKEESKAKSNNETEEIKKNSPEIKDTEVGVKLVLEGDINFKYDSDKLVLKAKEILHSVGKALKNKTYNIEIIGHTDNKGSVEYNLNLSEKRAKTVYVFLAKSRYISVHQTTYKGMGEAEPVADNSTESGRSKNRRVEIHIIPD